MWPRVRISSKRPYENITTLFTGENICYNLLESFTYVDCHREEVVAYRVIVKLYYLSLKAAILCRKLLMHLLKFLVEIRSTSLVGKDILFEELVLSGEKQQILDSSVSMYVLDENFQLSSILVHVWNIVNCIAFDYIKKYRCVDIKYFPLFSGVIWIAIPL